MARETGRYYVYIMFNERAEATYIGVTGNLTKRVLEHKKGLFPDSYTDRHDARKLGYFESYNEITDAIHREKLLKKWKRAWKYRLIETMNPNWLDLAEGFYTIGATPDLEGVKFPD
jgi:putative endonuclease